MVSSIEKLCVLLIVIALSSVSTRSSVVDRPWKPLQFFEWLDHGRIRPALIVRPIKSMTNIVASGKWYGTVDVIIAAPLEKAWQIGSDWLNFPSRCFVECVEGANGVPGCVRKVQPYNSRNWVTEKLTHIDHTHHIFSYDLVGGDSGIELGYQAAFQVTKAGEGKTRVVWPFRFSPDQRSVDSIGPLVLAKLTNYIKELEELAREL